MRRAFAETLEREMVQDARLCLLTADMGFGLWDAICLRFPARFLRFGASEQCMVAAAVGLALAGQVPICYTITPFLLWRPAEVIRLYLAGETVPVKLVGSGRDRDYGRDGPTHWAEDDHALLRCWPSIAAYWPRTAEDVPAAVCEMVSNKQPTYLNLRR
jgi:transketolase